MNHDDIIRMAREAGIDYHRHWDIGEDTNRLARFAALVAAAERDACARIAEEYMPYGLNCAEEIRERGKVNGRSN